MYKLDFIVDIFWKDFKGVVYCFVTVFDLNG